MARRDGTEPIETVLPKPGSYVCVVETNRQLSLCETAVVEVASGGPATFAELAVVSYG